MEPYITRSGYAVTNRFDPYYTWLGIGSDEQPADHYRLLGIRRFESNPEVISNASDRQLAHIRTFQTGPRSGESQYLLNELTAATHVLLNPELKAAYDLQLQAVLNRNVQPVPVAAQEVVQQAVARGNTSHHVQGGTVSGAVFPLPHELSTDPGALTTIWSFKTTAIAVGGFVGLILTLWTLQPLINSVSGSLTAQNTNARPNHSSVSPPLPSPQATLPDPIIDVPPAHDIQRKSLEPLVASVPFEAPKQISDGKATPAPPSETKPLDKSEPEQPAESATPAEPAKPVEPPFPFLNPEKAAPTKPTDPFPAAINRQTVDLPTLPAKSETADVPPALTLVLCAAKPDTVLTMNLKGGELVLKGKQKFTLEAAEQGRAPQAWDCKLEGVEDDPVIATFKVEEGELRFRWTEAALQQAASNALRNCVVTINGPGRDKPVEIFLRSPVKAPEGFVIDPSKPNATFRAMLESPPLEERWLSIQVLKVEGPPAFAFPNDRLELVREVGKPKGKKESGESRDPFLWLGPNAAADSLVLGIKLDPGLNSRTFQLSATPFYRVDATPEPQKLVKKQLPQLIKHAEANLMAAVSKELQTAALPNGELKEQAISLAKLEIQHASKIRSQISAVNTLLETMKDGVKLHFVLLFHADGFEVPLLIAGNQPVLRTRKKLGSSDVSF